MSFVYGTQSSSAIVKYITNDRLTAYLIACQGSQTDAIALYERNTVLSQALYGILQTFEVTLRNSFYLTLETELGRSDWYSINGLLDYREQLAIGDAQMNLQKFGKRVIPGRVVAELTMGFWVRLIAPRYEKRLWVPHLYKAFPNLSRPDRRSVFNRLEEIRKLRNRVAHHEPIFLRDLRKDYALVNEAVGWICLVTAAWMDSTNSLMKIL